MPTHELIIENARLLDAEGLHTIGIDDGHITAVSAVGGDLGAGGDRGAARVVDAAGNLVTPSFVNGHMHLCKTYTYNDQDHAALDAYATGTMGGAMRGIELASAVKANYTPESVYRGAIRAAREGVRNGVLLMQAFADTDTAAGMAGLDGVLRVRDELRDHVDIRVVAFPQDGVIKDPGAEDLIRRGVQAGADVVGGIPWIELTDGEARSHVDRMLEIAQRADKRVAMLVDDTGDPTMRTLEYLAERAESLGLGGRVTACHARAAGTYPEASFDRLTKLLLRAGVGVVSDPHTGSLHARPYDLYDAGVPVGLGQDDIEDAYYPLGRHNMLEVAFLAAHILGDLRPHRLRTVFDMITVSGARALGVQDHDLAAGNPANLVVLHGRTLREVLIHHAPPRTVISRGAVVAESTSHTEFHI